VDINVLGLDLEATGYYTPGDPGRLSGPPEKCYPPEASEFEFHTLTCEGKDAMFLLDSTMDDDIHMAAIEAYESNYDEDYDEDYGD
jgi:hypothetical protein